MAMDSGGGGSSKKRPGHRKHPKWRDVKKSRPNKTKDRWEELKRQSLAYRSPKKAKKLGYKGYQRQLDQMEKDGRSNKHKRPNKKRSAPNAGSRSGTSGQGHVSRSGGGGGSSRGGGGRGGGRGGGGGVSYNAPEYKHTGKNWREARQVVNDENNRLLRDYIRSAKNLRQDLGYAENQANSLYDRTKGDLDYVFNEAKDFIGNRNQKIDDRYAATGDALGNIFSGLQSAMQQNTNTNRDAAMAELQRLGVQQAGLGRFNEDANFAQNLAQQTGAFAQANNTMMGNSASEIGNMLQSMSQASLASAVGRATNDRNDEISGARQDYRRDISGIRDRINEVYAGRGAQVRDLQRSLENDAYQRWAEGQQRDFNNQLAANQFNLDVSQFNADQLWKKAAQRQALNKARRDRREAKRKGLGKLEDNARGAIDDAISKVLPWGY